MRKQDPVRYALTVGDLTINEALLINCAVRESAKTGKGVKRKVEGAVNALWAAHSAPRRADNLWRKYWEDQEKKRPRKTGK